MDALAVLLGAGVVVGGVDIFPYILRHTPSVEVSAVDVLVVVVTWAVSRADDGAAVLVLVLPTYGKETANDPPTEELV
jgi:hypothetical protein